LQEKAQKTALARKLAAQHARAHSRERAQQSRYLRHLTSSQRKLVTWAEANGCVSRKPPHTRSLQKHGRLEMALSLFENSYGGIALVYDIITGFFCGQGQIFL